MEKSRQAALVILATVCVTYFVENFLRSAAGALTPVLIPELGITRADMGLLTTAFFLIYGLMQFPSGVLADVLGPRRAIVGFTALTLVGATLFWLSTRYELLFIAQFIMGVGTSVFYINAVTVVGRWFPAERKATAIGILSAASGVGSFTSYMGFPLAATYLGSWRILYLAMLGILVLNWGMNLLLLHDAPEGVVPPRTRHADLIGAFRQALSDRHFFPMLFGFTMAGFNFVMFGWINQFLIESKGLTYVEAGAVSSIGTAAGFFGCIGVGLISDRLRSRRIPVLALYATSMVLFGVLTFLPPGLSFTAYGAVWGSMVFCGSNWVLFFSMVGEVLPPDRAAIGLGIMNGFSFLLSSLMAPVYGWLVDATKTYITPNSIFLGLSALTLVVLFTTVRETYGGAQVKEQPDTMK